MTTTIEDATGILLQIGGGQHKQPSYLDLEEDLGHNHLHRPWPIGDESVLTLVVTQAAEHVPPSDCVDWMNECWRVLKPGGRLQIVTPYGGSPPWLADPLAQWTITEMTPLWFDPEHPSSLWERYRPRPWKQEKVSWHRQGNLEIVLRKRAET